MKSQKRKKRVPSEHPVLAPLVDVRINGTVLMYDSLLNAVIEAGSTEGGFVWQELKVMTVVELLSVLGCNGIRFVYTKDNDELSDD